MEKYQNREQAGQILAQHLIIYAKRLDTLILALPRGGVPVAYKVSKILELPLDIFIVRKLGVPGHEELAMGAIASGNIVTYNEELLQQLHITEEAQRTILKKEREELARREQLYRGNKKFPDLKNKIIILIDDGIATGYTMRAAISALKKFKPKKIVVAVPVAAKETCTEIEDLVDEFICPLQPINFLAVGLWYEDFSQTTDEEVILRMK